MACGLSEALGLEACGFIGAHLVLAGFVVYNSVDGFAINHHAVEAVDDECEVEVSVGVQRQAAHKVFFALNVVDWAMLFYQFLVVVENTFYENLNDVVFEHAFAGELVEATFGFVEENVVDVGSDYVADSGVFVVEQTVDECLVYGGAVGVKLLNGVVHDGSECRCFHKFRYRVDFGKTFDIAQIEPQRAVDVGLDAVG